MRRWGTKLDRPAATISAISLQATPQQRRTVVVLAALLLAAFAWVAPFSGAKLPPFVSFNPVVQSIVFVTDFMTAVFLFAQYEVSRSRANLALATGYLYTAIIVIPYTLAYPGSFVGLINAGPQSSAWLYYCWIDGIPAGAIAYALLMLADRQTQGSVRTAIGWSVAFVIVHSLRLHLAQHHGYLVASTPDGRQPLYLCRYRDLHPAVDRSGIITYCIVVLCRKSILDYWLLLVMLSLLLNHITADFLGGERYSLGFYASRGFTIVTSTLVLTLLVKHLRDLYVRLANSNKMLERERSNRLMHIEAVTASIVHEMKQPLTAIVANGGAALALLDKKPPDLAEAKAGLRDMIDDSHGASRALDAIRTLVQRVDPEREPINMNDLALEALQSMRSELMSYGVSARPQIMTDIPPIRGNRNQLRQVLLNLIHNAVEAMDARTSRHRTVTVKTGLRGQHAIKLTVEDSGPGIDPDRLEGVFDAFVTTKTHGMGLGLAICRTIIEKHGGQLNAFSDGKTGAAFEVVLPIAPSVGSAVQAE